MPSFLCTVLGLIFSAHRLVRLWNAVFIEAVTVVKMTGVWSHPVYAPPPPHPAHRNIAIGGDGAAGLLGNLDKDKRRQEGCVWNDMIL